VTGTGAGILLITAGAVFRFALPAGSPHGLNLHVVGVILILAGVLHLVLPQVVRASHNPDRLRRWVRPSQAQVGVEPPAGGDRGSPGDPTLADEVLGYEDRSLR
jgi:hypothetical protein